MIQGEDSHRIRYEGEEKISVAIDVGTTHSGVSFVHLFPGDYVDVKMVTKWEGQPGYGGDSKIPTLVAYKEGKAQAFGAKARDLIGDEGIEIAKHFKLKLHPKSTATLGTPGSSLQVPGLPSGVGLRQVYTDFLRFIFQYTRKFFQDNTPKGFETWSRLQDDIVVVLTIPNGWDTIQHNFLRGVAIDAGLVHKDKADNLLDFVTESEASVHYILQRTSSHRWLEKGTMFAVCDAGGSTIDSVLYECTDRDPRMVLKEVCASECVQAGGVFVDQAARHILQEKLRGSKYGAEDYISEMVDDFESKTKRIFDGSQEENTIKFGNNRDSDRKYQILKGRITLSKDEVARSFYEVLTQITTSCLKLLQGRDVNHLLLVGGFGDSPFLRHRLREIFKLLGTEVVTTDEPSKKAAAEGASVWFTRQIVAARAARFSIGVSCSIPYNAADLEHIIRWRSRFIDVSGRKMISEKFCTLVERDRVLDDGFQITEEFYRTYATKPEDLGCFSADLQAWEGEGRIEWTTDINDHRHDQLRRICTLQADLSRLKPSLKSRTGKNGATYWQVDFQYVISFGVTKLNARLQWEENGVLREGPVNLLVDSVA